MAKYDYQLAKAIIEKEKENISSADLGMHEDWGWTAQEVYNSTDGFTKDLDDEDLSIAGINGSTWATPVLQLYYKDDTEKTFKCYEGAVTPENKSHIQNMLTSGGPISGPINEARKSINLEDYEL